MIHERLLQVSVKILVRAKPGETREDVINNFWEIIDEDHRALEVDIEDVTEVKE